MSFLPQFDFQFQKLVRHIFDTGSVRGDRTGTGTTSVFCPPPLVIDLEESHIKGPLWWPATTLRKINPQAPLTEMLWVLRGDTNTEWLKKHGVNYWDKWASASGDLGPVYGAQMREFGSSFTGMPVDQLKKAIRGIMSNPMSRRHMVSLWNPAEEHLMRLPPCHGNIIQFYVSEGGLSMSMYQRSCDVVIGLPYNVAMYTAFLYIMCKMTGLLPDRLIIHLGDAHIYSNLETQAHEMLGRTPYEESTIELPDNLVDLASLETLVPSDFRIRDYISHPAINCQVSV